MKQAIQKAIEGGWQGYIGRLATNEETLESWLKYSAELEWEELFKSASPRSCFDRN